MRNREHIAILIAALPMLSSCWAHHVVFKPHAVHRAQLRQPPLPYVVRLTWNPAQGRHPRPYSYLGRVLRETAAFSEVQFDSCGTTSGLSQPHLHAYPVGDDCSTTPPPVLALVTLGLLPTVWTDHACTAAVFRRADGTRPGDSVVVRIHHRGPAIVGWLALPLLILPSWTQHAAHFQREYTQAFRLAIIAKQNELAHLAEP